jgi:hypothetical protein
MGPDCLERMVEALERNPGCGLCHCCLEIIDGNGAILNYDQAWENWQAQLYFDQWIHQYHVRKAPHDGLLHFGFYTVYSSLTQLLVRRRVFDEVGLFRIDCSPHADFEWGMRVGLTENVVHVPLKLATWRRHASQATQTSSFMTARAQGEFSRLVPKALQSLSVRSPTLAKKLGRSDLNDFYLVHQLDARRRLGNTLLARFFGAANFALRHPLFSARWLVHKLFHNDGIIGDFGDAVRREFTKLNLTNLVVRLEPW